MGKGLDRYPRVIQRRDDDNLIIYYRLVKAGYGNFFEVQQMTAREVIQALSYEDFLSDYERTFLELNKK